jgi:endonuclease-8
MTAKQLHRALAGKLLTGSDFRVPRLATVDLTGYTVLESTCRGKHLLLRVHRDESRLTVHSHLRMDGAWRTYRPGQPWTAGHQHTIRIVLRAADTVAVGFHLHDISLVPTEQESTVVGHLGPDLLGGDWNLDEAVRRVQDQPDRPIAEAITDQRNLAGIGNIYKSEVLYLRGVNPWSTVADVRDVPAMIKLAHRLLNANRDRVNRTTTGSTRRGETSHVYDRRGRPCRRCGTPIRLAEQDDRLTYWCPTCQPGAGPPR